MGNIKKVQNLEHHVSEESREERRVWKSPNSNIKIISRRYEGAEKSAATSRSLVNRGYCNGSRWRCRVSTKSGVFALTVHCLAVH